MTEEERKTLGQMKMYAELDRAMKERERAKSMKEAKTMDETIQETAEALREEERREVAEKARIREYRKLMREREEKKPLLWFLVHMESILRHADDFTAGYVRDGIIKYITTWREETKEDIYRNWAKEEKNVRALFIAILTLYHYMEADL